MMNDNWSRIYSTQYEHIAEIVKAVLEDNDMDCVLVSKKDSAYLFGEIELYVNVENVLRAKQIIKREKL